MKNTKKPKNKATVATMIGTVLESYDMSLYGFMLPLLVVVFLPTYDKAHALVIAAVVMQCANILVRPLGALFIGKIADRYGRRQALMIAIGGMAIATCMVGLLPTYFQIGFAAPVLLVILRSLQGFFVAGEYNSGAVFALEHSKGYGKGYLSGLYCMFTMIGALCAILICSAISYLPEWCWRIPYLIGSITGLVGLYIRGRVPESPMFLKYQNFPEITLAEIAKKYKLLLSCIGVVGLFNALYFLPTVLMISLLPMVTSYSVSTIMSVNSCTTVLYVIALPLFGYIGDKISFHKSMGIAAAAVLIMAYPLISLISYNKLEYIIVMKICFALLTAWFAAPFHAWIQTLFHTRERCTAISFSYTVGSQLGGAMAPLALWSWEQSHSIAVIYYVLMFWSAAAIIGLYSQRFAFRHE